jgi:transglutaminase-like putative cysteine protease
VGSAVPHITTYAIEERLKIREIPAGAKKLRVWFWMPIDDAAQQVTDISVKSAPAGYKIVGDGVHGERLLYAEVAEPKAGDLSLAIAAIVQRREELATPDPQAAGALTADLRQFFAESLREDVPNMEVDARIRKIANEVCGDETNVVEQAHRIYNYVVDNTDHYSKKTVTASTIGSQAYCLENKGGSCTDMHSLFIALCRARGIPARIVFGSRLKPENAGKDVDPGYRCWVYVFAPRIGWFPVECAAGDTVEGKKEYYFGNLDDRRVCWIEGRNRVLVPPQDGPVVNYISRAAYVEIDGKPHAAIDLNVNATNK